MPFQAADVTGDGKADIVYEDSNQDIRVMVSDGTKFIEGETRWGRRAKPYHSTTWGGGERVHLSFHIADVNGDSIGDVVYGSSDSTDNVRVLLGTGTGFLADAAWGTRSGRMVSFACSDGPLCWDTPVGFLAFDWNGDSMADFAYFDKDTESVRVMLSSGTPASGFVAETTWANIGEPGRMA